MHRKAYSTVLVTAWLASLFLAMPAIASPAESPARNPGIVGNTDPEFDALWQRVKDVFGAGELEGEGLAVPGADVRVILSRIIPGLDQYMQLVVDNLDLLEIKRGQGKIVVDAKLITTKLDFALREKKATRNGQVYKVRFYKHLHFEISMKKENVYLEKIEGLRVSVKLPIIPDGVFPRGLFVNNAAKTMTLHAEAIGKLVDVIATADLKGGNFKGIEWLKSLAMNLPRILKAFLFNLFI